MSKVWLKPGIEELGPKLGSVEVWDDVFLVDEYPVCVYSARTGERYLKFGHEQFPIKHTLDELKRRVSVEHDQVFCFFDDRSASRNFGHFLMDTSHGLLQYAAFPGFELIGNSVPFIREFVELWSPGLPLTSLVLDGSVHHIQQIVKPRHLCWHGGPIPDNVLEFYVTVRDRAPVVPVSSAPYLMITRRDSTYRLLENEALLIQLVEEFGYVAKEFAPLSLIERINLVRNAKCLFTHCGAGACNHVWISPGTTTVTLYHPGLHREEYNNSKLTKLRGGTPYALDEYGVQFSGGDNIVSLLGTPWKLPAVEPVVEAVLALTLSQ